MKVLLALCLAKCLILCLPLCWSDLIAVENVTSTSILNPSTIYANKNEENNNTSIANSEASGFPPDCSQREKHKTPLKHKHSHIKKCCPIGESLSMTEDSQNTVLCGSASVELKPNLVNVSLYDNCIEDMETVFTLPFEIGNPCNTSVLYNNMDDLFFIVQDGSLLVMDFYANESYALYNNYCVDINNISGVTYAIVCLTSIEEHISRSQIVVVAILMLISIPCLLFVAYVHIRIRELRSLHGIILSCMSACLATGNLLYSLVHIFNIDERNTGYAVQFFMLSYYFWYLSLCCNVAVNIWMYIPLNRKKTKLILGIYFSVYCMTSFIGAVTLVICTVQKGLPGMPSYFMQGYTESIRESQRYFIPPVSTLIFLSFLLLAATFFGFQRLRKQNAILEAHEDSAGSCSHDKIIYGEVKKDAKCISFLGLILLSTWLLEIVTFYSPGPEVYLILMDMINGLQGVFVLLIFLVMRKRRTIIFRWWSDRGSYTVVKTDINLLTTSAQS